MEQNQNYNMDSCIYAEFNGVFYRRSGCGLSVSSKISRAVSASLGVVIVGRSEEAFRGGTNCKVIGHNEERCPWKPLMVVLAI